DAFAVQRRHRGDAQIEVATAKGEADTAILRQAPLGAVHERHDLDARDDGGPQANGWFGRRLQNTVDAIAHEQPAVERLDVNVRGAALDGANDQQVDQTDHRRFARQVTQAVDVLDGAGIVAVRDLPNELAELAVAAVVEPLMCGLDIRPRRDLRPDDAAGAHLDGAPCVA